MFDRKKVKEMQMTDEDYKSSNTNSSKNQREYENKVKKFLGYCQKFEKALVAENNLETVENIRTCFNSSFKDYYKNSKKFSLFSHTTKILKGMDKALKKSGKLKLGDAKAVKNIKDAFKYARTNPTKDKDLIKRSAIDDKAVWKFFNSEIPKIIDDICSKNKEELDKLKAEQAEQQDNLIPFIRKLLTELEKVERNTVVLKKEVEATNEKSEKVGQKIEEVDEANQEVQEKAGDSNNVVAQKATNQVDGRIDNLKEKKDAIGDDVDNLAEKVKNMKNEIEVLNGCVSKFGKDGQGDLSQKEKEALSKLGLKNAMYKDAEEKKALIEELTVKFVVWKLN